MELKKINPNLQKALAEHGITTPTELQQETFSTIKSGADCILACPDGSGKTTTLVLNMVQKLAKAEGESTRGLFIAEDKEAVVAIVALFEKYAAYTDLRFYGTHDKGDIDYDKNQISLGLDILIGTPTRINAMFSSAGFNLTTVKIFAVDDADKLFKNRHDAIVLRLAGSIVKTQFVFTCETVTERVEIIADKVMTEPLFFEIEEEDEDATN